MIGEANWIDVIQEGRTIRSLQMGPRLECIRYGKKIEFPLKAGTASCNSSVRLMTMPTC